MSIPFVGDLIDAVKDLVSEVVVDKDKKAEVNLELEKLRDAGNQRAHDEIIAQIEVNKVEASSGSVFVAGWRPATGWIGAAALGYSAILYPAIEWATRVAGYQGTLPVLDNTLLMTIMTGMLGIGAMRSYEKTQGVSTNDYTDVPRKSTPLLSLSAGVPRGAEVDCKLPGVFQTEELPGRRDIAWGSHVSPVFKDRIWWIADELGLNPDDLMSCIAWESGESFAPDVKNAAGSGATGLIQFMPSTAVGMGTTTSRLARMTAEDQLNYVYKYFLPFKGRLHNLGDIYMAILWPKGVGKPDGYVLWDKGSQPTTFRQNAGLDINKDKRITRGECLTKIKGKLTKGLSPQHIG